MPRAKPATSPDDLLTMSDACRLLGVSAHTVTYHLQRGALAAQRVGRAWIFRRGEVERFAAIPRKRGRKAKVG